MGVTYRAEIIRALKELEGAASLKEICQNISQENNLEYVYTNPNWERRVSAELQCHCKETKSYSGGENIFYSVYGLGEGVWGLYSFLEKENFDYDSIKEKLISRQLAKIKDDSNISDTEKEALIRARRGQGLFRKKLLNKYKCCVISSISDERLLIASHIKPWRNSNNLERLSSENGLILSPTYDRLFDIGLISFSNEGQIKVSENLNDYNKRKLTVDNKHVYIKDVSRDMRINLEYHRDIVFNKTSIGGI